MPRQDNDCFEVKVRSHQGSMLSPLLCMIVMVNCFYSREVRDGLL